MNTVVAITPPGMPELIVIVVVLVLLFGARKLPELGSSVGQSIKNFKKGIAESRDAGSETSTPDPDPEQVGQDSRPKSEQ
ncbi:MAG: twin-arginine translocase TatA/TatE family subunit [Egibacteraceae bacterium]